MAPLCTHRPPLSRSGSESALQVGHIASLVIFAQFVRPTLINSAQDAHRTLPINSRQLLIRNCSTGRARELDKFKTLEPNLVTPFTEICSSVVEGITEFD